MVARASLGKMAWANAVECLSTLSISEVLCENLTAYTEIKLYRASKTIHTALRYDATGGNAWNT